MTDLDLARIKSDAIDATYRAEPLADDVLDLLDRLESLEAERDEARRKIEEAVNVAHNSWINLAHVPDIGGMWVNQEEVLDALTGDESIEVPIWRDAWDDERKRADRAEVRLARVTAQRDDARDVALTRGRALARVTDDSAVEVGAKAAYEQAFLKHAPADVDRWDDLVTDNDPSAESWREVARAVIRAVAADEQETT